MDNIEEFDFNKILGLNDNEIRIGVYICHCGTDIGGTINIDELVAYASSLPNVTIARQYPFYCSDKGQMEIAKDIEGKIVNRVVVAACSPRLYESTFRKVLSRAGLNPFLYVQANIREHVALVNTLDPKGATRIAKDHIAMEVSKVAKLKPLIQEKVKIKPVSLVIGAGIAGINATLDLVKQGYEVFLVEKDPAIGGHVAQLDKTFPTMENSACLLTSQMVEISQNPKIHLLTYTEVEKIDGYVGNFTVTVRQKARFVDSGKCTACGKCAEGCPVPAPNEFDQGLTPRKAIFIPYVDAIPKKYTIDIKKCIECGICERICEFQAINLEEKPRLITFEVGTIIVSTGYDLINAHVLPYLGYGKYENVINALEMERLLNFMTSKGVNLMRPSDGKEPQSIAWVQCVGSRDTRNGCKPYCSRVCCLNAIKQAIQYKEKYPLGEAYIFYMDIQAFGKGYEDFVQLAMQQYNIHFIRGFSDVIEKLDKSLVIRAEDTLLDKLLTIKLDLLILSTGIQCRSDAGKVGAIMNIHRSTDGFFLEAQSKLRPVDASTEGIFIAGASQGPKDITDVISQAKGAVSGAVILMSQGELEVEPYYAVVNEAFCSGCRGCLTVCPYGAIKFDENRHVAVITSINCKCCGTCVALCASNAISQNYFSNEEILAEIEAALPLEFTINYEKI